LEKETLKVEDIKSENGFIIAETACGHEGDIKKLFELIEAAASAKANAIKFQIFVPLERSHQGHSEWEIFNNLFLKEEEWKKATKYARDNNLYVFADVFGFEGLSIASNCEVDGYKVHSEDMLNTVFIKDVISKKKITMLGVGAIKRIELFRLIKELKQSNLLNNIILIPGVQVFPTPLSAHSLSEVSDLIENYSFDQLKVGFADHLDGSSPEAITLPQKALLTGAIVLEKHITIDRKLKWEDYESALDASDFEYFVSEVKKTCKLITKFSFMNEHEKKYRSMFKKMPCSSKNLSSGSLIKIEDISFKKQDNFSVPISSLDLIGKRLKKEIHKDEIFRFDHFEDKVGAIIVVRNTSTRLPQKALKKILGVETIVLLIRRIKRCKNLDCIVLATSNEESDDIFEEIAKKEQVYLYRGSKNNVAERFYKAAEKFSIDHIVRVTGDDILRDEIMIDKAIKSHLFESCNVTFTRNMPYGCASEIFSFKTLETILETVKEPANTEYLEYYLENDRYFSKNQVFSDYKNFDHIRLTLDYEEDFRLFEKIFTYFESVGEKNFTVEMVIEWLAANKHLLEINSKMKTKFDQLDLDVSLKI